MVEKSDGGTVKPDGKVVIDASGAASDVGEDRSIGIPLIDPNTIPERGPEPPKRRGRPPGKYGTYRKSATPGAAAGEPKKTASDLTAILMSAHMLLANITGVAEIELDEKEAKTLSEAVNRIEACYEIPVLTEKQLAWVNLCMVSGTIYGTRYVAYRVRRKKEREKEPKTVEAQVFQVH